MKRLEKLTDTERWMLVNQYRILAAVDPRNKEDHELAADILERGYEHLYDELTPLSESEPVSREACEKVEDILWMFTKLHTSYDRLADKEGIDPARVTFMGFDGNEENPQYAYAKLIIQRMGRFDEFAKGPFNSHMPMLYVYDRMLEVYEGFQASGAASRDLTRDEIIAVVTASA